MTVYFPLVVHGAMLVEPTESESRASLDLFVATLRDLVFAVKAGKTRALHRSAALRPAPPPRRDARGAPAGAEMDAARALRGGGGVGTQPSPREGERRFSATRLSHPCQNAPPILPASASCCLRCCFLGERRARQVAGRDLWGRADPADPLDLRIVDDRALRGEGRGRAVPHARRGPACRRSGSCWRRRRSRSSISPSGISRLPTR